MSQSLNPNQLERQAYLRTFEDGLLDIYLGGLLISFAAFGFTVFPGRATSSFITLFYFLVGVSLSSLVFWLGKRYLTLPRIGLVKFGPARQKRARDLFLALVVIVAVQALVIVLQFSYLLSPVVRGWLAPLLGPAESNNLLIAVVGAIFVAPGMLLIAYMTDNPRGYYHAVVFSLAVFMMILLDQAWWMVLGGVLILLPGVVHFVRFLQRYPLEDQPDERR